MSTGSLRTIYASSVESPDPLVQENLQWAMYDSQCADTRMVMVRAGNIVLEHGDEIVRDGIAQLVLQYKHLVGTPTLISPTFVQPPIHPSLWFFVDAELRYHVVAFDPVQQCVVLTPVFSMDPRFANGSEAAMSLLFPDDAPEAIKVLTQLFAAAP